MSAIGGIANWNQPTVDTEPLFHMSRAMLLRGGARRSAYLHGNLALLQHRAPLPNDPEPTSLVCRGNRTVAVLDGAPSLGSEELCCFWEEAAPERLTDAYEALREALADALHGPFALAIADEERAELYLARDGEGARPLFYREEEGTFYFASEIKALLQTTSSAVAIDAEQLRQHLLSPYGTLGCEELYRDLTSLPAGHSALLSRLGLRIFPNTPPSPCPPPPTADLACPELYFPTESELSLMLGELLYAFDAPQFDYLMPSLLHTLSELRAKGSPRALTFEDPSLCMNLRYAHERADRIGSIYGFSLTPIAPHRFFAKERELRRLERTLRSLLGSIDTAPLRQLLGEKWSAKILGEKNTAKRIRMEGMAYQILLWERRTPLRLL